MGNDASRVLEDVSRVVDTSVASVGALGRITFDPRQAARLADLIAKHDFPGLIGALTSRRPLAPDFFPAWIRRAGGYFPKFAQVLSVRADLIEDPQVLEGLSRCLEDMPSRPAAEVQAVLRQEGLDQLCDSLGPALNAGTVAQVHSLSLHGLELVLKVTFPEARRRFDTDFRLFGHARQILGALKLNDEKANIVAAMFDAVGKSEQSVLAEFDLREEANAMQIADGLLPMWPAVYAQWKQCLSAGLSHGLPHVAAAALQGAEAASAAWCVAVPAPVESLVTPGAMVMTRAGGESLQQLMATKPKDAAMVFLGLVVPFMGWLLLTQSSSHLAHVDPHLGNFRWEDGTLWVLDWGASLRRFSPQKRRALQLLVRHLATGGPDACVAQAAEAFGVAGDSPAQVAQVIRGLFNASSNHAAQDSLQEAASQDLLRHIDQEVVPVVRCLAILGGILKMMQQQIREEHHHDIPLSLAFLWAPFAES
ncbi:unnamed protein product [Effrenium voratum]|nr:unnamed protein product [Effrenium voratum]